TPFLPIDRNYSSHFREPMVFPYQEGLVILSGASDLNGQGKIVDYFSKDRNVHNFHQLGEFTFTDQELGYMVECPNLDF
ncbi:sucrose-6-phosphate hydrolase, partial [Enterococcus faecalis]